MHVFTNKTEFGTFIHVSPTIHDETMGMALIKEREARLICPICNAHDRVQLYEFYDMVQAGVLDDTRCIDHHPGAKTHIWPVGVAVDGSQSEAASTEPGPLWAGVTSLEVWERLHTGVARDVIHFLVEITKRQDRALLLTEVVRLAMAEGYHLGFDDIREGIGELGAFPPPELLWRREKFGMLTTTTRPEAAKADFAATGG